MTGNQKALIFVGAMAGAGYFLFFRKKDPKAAAAGVPSNTATIKSPGVGAANLNVNAADELDLGSFQLRAPSMDTSTPVQQSYGFEGFKLTAPTMSLKFDDMGSDFS